MSVNINTGVFLQWNSSSKNEEITSKHANTVEAQRQNSEQKEAKFTCDERSQNSGYLWGEAVVTGDEEEA